MDLQLANRIALVAASSQGLGYATALQLSREGALVAICSRDKARIAAAVDSIKAETGGAVFGMVADMTHSEDVDSLVQHTVDEFGGLDIVVTNAGGPPSLPFEEVTDEQWQAAVDLNLMSTVRLVRAALPHLRQSSAPSVLTITSFTVKQPLLNLVLSNSIRMGVIGLTKTLALELASDRIRCNSILPGWTETERIIDLMAARAARNSTTPESEFTKQTAAIPLGRMATPAEFANAATFLVSPAASYINGVMLLVDGGLFSGTF